MQPRSSNVGEQGSGRSITSAFLLLTSDLCEVRSKALHDSVDVFLKYVRAHDAAKIAEAFVFAGLDACKSFFAVHHVRLDINDRALVQAICQKVPSPDVTGDPDAFCVRSGVSKWGESGHLRHRFRDRFRAGHLLRITPFKKFQQHRKTLVVVAAAPIHESRSRLGCLLKARRSAGRWWSSDKADWKSVVVTWSGRRLYPLHWMKRLLLKRSIIPRTNIALSLRTLHRSSLWEISKR